MSFKRRHHKKKAVYTRRENAHNSHVPSDANDKVISFINSQNLGWTADICKLQKHHKDYSKEECESGDDALLMTQVEEQNKQKVFGEDTAEFKRAFKSLQ